jgi:HAD superfamily hydrolase (TIGR01484 family)
MNTSTTPLRHADPHRLAGIDFILTDVDDTLTRHGKLSPVTLEAIERLRDAGVRVIPVTGGCAGWCDHIVRAWPVDAVIGESGAFSFRLSPNGALQQRFTRPLVDLRAEQQQLLKLAEVALGKVPAARLAADQPYRLADVAIDHAQDIAPLPAADVEAIIGVFQRAGARARASSIHVNAWFGEHDKASMAARLLTEDYGLNMAEQARRVLFIGDAPNDESLFRAYPISVGVANIKPHLDRLAGKPRWLCDTSHGEGFTEMADHLLAVRQTLRSEG